MEQHTPINVLTLVMSEESNTYTVNTTKIGGIMNYIRQKLKPTVMRMKSGLKRTLSPQSLISCGPGSFVDNRAVMDSLFPPLTMATKSSTIIPFFVSSRDTQKNVWFGINQRVMCIVIAEIDSHLPSHSVSLYRIQHSPQEKREPRKWSTRSESLPAHKTYTGPNYNLE